MTMYEALKNHGPENDKRGKYFMLRSGIIT
jgi:hypothetical protein